VKVSEAYPLASMGQFLSHRKEFFQLDDATEYQLVTVQLHGRGVRERTQLLGKAIKTKRQQRVRAGELLVAEIDAKAGGFGVIPDHLDGAIVSSHYFLYKIDETVIERTYLDYYLRSGRPEFDIQTFVQGSLNYAAIRPHHFPELSIPLPPLDAQRRIVAKLDALRARVEQALALQGAAIAEAEALILANSATIFMRLIEQGAQMARIDDCCRIGTGLQKSPARRPKAYPTPYLRVANVQRNYLDLAEIKELEVTPDELERLRLQPGDVLVVEGNGSIDNIGRTALWHGEIENCVHQNHIIRLRPNVEVVSGEFINAFLNSPLGRQQAAALSVTTSGLYVLSAGKVRQIQLPLPSVAEQQAVVAELERMQSRVRRMIDLQHESEQELEAMLPAALDRAFRGEL